MRNITVYLDDEKYKKFKNYVLQEAMRNGNNPSMSRAINNMIDLLLADPVPDSKPPTEHRVFPTI
jgi:hypothetical protein